ncbi:MAG: hypothetical protein RMK92_05525 [Armatimonadota bacterium]|nr:hypothetical protein [Armatimonadota bacterium]
MLPRVLSAMTALAAIALLSGCGTHVEFSPDGKKLLVSGGSEGLVLMNADGSGRQQLPNTMHAAYAIWSPDGRYILYEVPDWMGNRKRSKVFLYDLQAGAARALKGYLCAPYTFSHDGTQVVACDREKQCLVWLDSSSGERLLEVPCPVTPQGARLHWLPDRHGVAFLAHEESNATDVYTVEAGKLYRLSTTGDVVGLGVSPDGKRLLWTRQTGTGARAVLTAFSYDLDARSVRKLPLQVNMGDLFVSRSPGGAHLHTLVAFSPNAQFVVVIVSHHAEGEAQRQWLRGVVMPLAGGEAKEVLRALPSAKRPELAVDVAWSPDSQRVAFLSLRGQKQDKQQEQALRVRVSHADSTGARVIDL